jgi:hypothetical protein
MPLLIGILTVGVSAVSCLRSTYELTIIIPDGFKGYFEIAEDKSLFSNNDSRDTFTIPESGVLVVRSIDLFHKFHNLNVVTYTGERVSSGQDVKIGCHELFYRRDDMDRPSVWFLVGDISTFDWNPLHISVGDQSK